MRHEMLTQRAPFCIGAVAKKGTLSQHFVKHVVPPLSDCILGTFSSLWFSLHCYCEVSDMCHEYYWRVGGGGEMTVMSLKNML